MKVRLLIICVVSGFHTLMASAQVSVPFAEIESIVKKAIVSKSDWIIAMSVEQGGNLLSYDSLGMLEYTVPTATILFLNIGGKLFSQKISYETNYESSSRSVVIEQRKPIPDKEKLNYTVDSLLLTDKEFIYPFIFKNETRNAYGIQEASDHRSRYGMYFKTSTRRGNFFFFNDIDFESAIPLSEVTNVNYSYNVSTFIYRSFQTLFELTYRLKL